MKKENLEEDFSSSDELEKKSNIIYSIAQYIDSVLAVMSAHSPNASFSGTINGQVHIRDCKRLSNISIIQV